MNLLKALFSIFDLWRPAFCKHQAFNRAKELAIASLTAYGRKTITNMALLLGRNTLPVADYKFYSECKWNVEDLFNPILKKASDYIKENYICIAADDTRIHKTGKKIPTTKWYRDAMGPPFRMNLMWGLRFLQMSLLLPMHRLSENISARAIPIRFISAPSVKKPKKNAPEQAWIDYRRLANEMNLSSLFVKYVKQLRACLDSFGYQNKKLLMAVDGSFCNKRTMNMDDPNIVMVARCRKSAKLCFPAQGKGRRVYDEKKFSPEEVRQNENIVWQKQSFFYGGRYREMRFKTVSNVLWQGGTKRKLLRLIVLAPLPYVRGGKRSYRAPAYLLSTDLEGPLDLLIQAYLDRWQIEYNHRDEKSILGVGEAQLWNELSVEKQPGFHVAVYSALLLANVVAYGDRNHLDFGPAPPWRRQSKRNTCRALIGLLRSTLIEEPEQLEEMGMTFSMISAILRQAA